MSSLIISNQKVVDFYNKNKHIDFEKINILLVDMLENITSSSLENPSIVNEIMKSLMEQNKDITKLLSTVTSSSEIYKSELNNIKSLYANTSELIKNDMEHIKLLLTNINSNILNKIYETKDMYINEVRTTLKTNDNDTLINLSSTLNTQNQMLSDKLQLIINDIIPKSQATYIDSIINKFKTETSELVTNNNKNLSLDKISLIIETKSNNMIQNIQDQLIKYITMTEDRINNNLNNIKEITTKNNITQELMNDELSTYLNKYKKSVSKGGQSEEKLYKLLTDTFPSAEVINTTGNKGMGDMILKRKDKNNILIENKDYTTNVHKEEIEKFLRDITINKCNGIMISQHTGIVGKENYQIDIHDNNILVYIHNFDNDFYKLKLAVNIIDILSTKLTIINDKHTTISKELLVDINNEFQSFIIQKDKIITSLKDYYKKTIEQLTDINLPNLELFLSNFYANNKKNLLICEFCKKFETDNLRSLARHKYACKNKKEININSESTDTNSDTSTKNDVESNKNTPKTKKKPKEIII